MSGSWKMVYEIAAKRDTTKAGKDHMTGHAHDVLESRFLEEVQDAMIDAMGYGPVPEIS